MKIGYFKGEKYGFMIKILQHYLKKKSLAFHPNVKCTLKYAFHEDFKIHLDNTIWTLYIVKAGLKKADVPFIVIL